MTGVRDTPLIDAVEMF